jgi:hypothetical protein
MLRAPCRRRVPGKLNVHLVAHTHDDGGWLKVRCPGVGQGMSDVPDCCRRRRPMPRPVEKRGRQHAPRPALQTFDEYYYGDRQDIQVTPAASSRAWRPLQRPHGMRACLAPPLARPPAGRPGCQAATAAAARAPPPHLATSSSPLHPLPPPADSRGAVHPGHHHPNPAGQPRQAVQLRRNVLFHQVVQRAAPGHAGRRQEAGGQGTRDPPGRRAPEAYEQLGNCAGDLVP